MGMRRMAVLGAAALACACCADAGRAGPGFLLALFGGLTRHRAPYVSDAVFQ
jgi:hypothetical protein